MSEEKDVKKKLDSLISSMDKKYGKGTVFVGADASENVKNIPRWEIESPAISYVLGGGLPKGRMIELYGPESGGKTSIATFLASQVQKAGDKVAVIDAENAFDLEYAQTLGLNTNEIIFTQPDSGNDALQIAEELTKSELIKLIIIDSVAALTPKEEMEAEMGDQQMGLQARLMSKACRKLSPVMKDNGTTIIFINQIREKIGVMFGNPETTPGGRAIKFFSSIRLDIRKIETINQGQDIIGIKSRLTARKNKTAPPFRKGEIEIIFGQGLQFYKEYVDFAVNYNIIEKGGAWYTLKDKKGNLLEKMQGGTSVAEYLREHEEYYNFIKNSVLSAMNPKNKTESEEDSKVKTRKKKSSKKEEELIEVSEDKNKE